MCAALFNPTPDQATDNDRPKGQRQDRERIRRIGGGWRICGVVLYGDEGHRHAAHAHERDPGSLRAETLDAIEGDYGTKDEGREAEPKGDQAVVYSCTGNHREDDSLQG